MRGTESCLALPHHSFKHRASAGTVTLQVPSAGYVAALKQHSRKMLILALRQLLRMVREYPREPLKAAVAEAARYGLYDLDRVERMILRMVARDYFLLNKNPESE